jgi:hypothetical protein
MHGGFRVGGARYDGGAVVRERVDRRRDIDVRYRIANLLLEDCLWPPRDAGLDQVLHQKQRRLAMVDAREHCLPIPDLLAIDQLSQRLTRLPSPMMPGSALQPFRIPD